MPSVYQTVFGGNPVAPAIPTYLPLSFSVNTILGWPLESNITSPAAAEWIDCNATAPALTLQLSDARQVSTGYTAIFNNVGANTFSVLDAQGNTLMAPASGAAWILVLSDNSTLQGTWRALQLGAGTSVANAAALAGNGLKAITTTLNERIFINPQAANYVIQTAADRAVCVEWTGGAGGTFTTPTAAAAGSDWFCYIKNSGTGVLTLTPGSGNLDGTANKTFNPNDSCIVVCDGSNFFTMGFGQSVASSFNFVTISLAGASGTVVLTGAQLNRISYKFTGALAGNTIVQVPASIQQYWIDNETTGAFTLTISAGGAGTTFTVPQANRNILYCDGLNIVNAISSGAIQFADGTAAAPSITFASDTTLGFYKAGVDVLGISTAGVQRGTINASGQWVINAPSSGAALSITPASGTVIISARTAPADGDVLYIGRTGATNNPYFRVNVVESTSTTTLDANSSTAVGVLALATLGTIRISISSAGNVTINAPSSGKAVAVTGAVPGAAADRIASFDVTGGDSRLAITTTTSGNAQVNFDVFGVQNWAFGGRRSDGALVVSSAQDLSIPRVIISNAGNVTVNAPSSGTAITVSGQSNANTVQITGANTSSQSFGLRIDSGTNASDAALNVFNRASTINYFQIRGDGVVTLPAGVQPMFNASRTVSAQTLTAGATTALIFNTANSNQGSAYNAATGVFTAPVAGVYLFAAMPVIQNNAAGAATLSLWFSVNSAAAGPQQIVPIGFSINAASQPATYPGSTILVLGAGATVQINATVGTNNLQHGVAGSSQSTFAGYLLG